MKPKQLVYFALASLFASQLSFSNTLEYKLTNWYLRTGHESPSIVLQEMKELDRKLRSRDPFHMIGYVLTLPGREMKYYEFRKEHGLQ